MTFRGTWISNPTSWPRPDETWVWSYNLNLIGKDSLPNRSTDRPNPLIPAPIDQTWTQRHVQFTGKDTLPSNQDDWPNSQPAQWYRDWSQNFVLTHQVAQRPFSQQDWPNTQPSQWYRDWQESGNSLGTPGVPTNQTDWPNPKPVNWYQDWNNTLVLNMPVFMPSTVSYWDIPPSIAWYQNWQVNLLQTTLAAPPAPLPNNQYDWSNPVQPYRLEQSWIWNQTKYLGQDRLPNRQQYWPNPYPIQWYLPSNLGTLPFLFPTPAPLPLNQYSWPNPSDYLRQVDQNNYTYTSPFMPPTVIPVVTGGGIFPENFWKRMLDLDREQKSKHEAAVELGRLGGQARAKILTPHQRATLASNAAKARWK